VVEPSDIPRILLDAARLIQRGDVVVFGSAALAFWLPEAPSTRDVDLWCEPAEKGDAVEALMGELSWYHDRHGAYVEVWGPEAFAAPRSWRQRAKILTDEDLPEVRLVVPHPHDILFAKLERWELADKEHARAILAFAPLGRVAARSLDESTPYRTGGIDDSRRVRAYLAHLEELMSWLD